MPTKLAATLRIIGAAAVILSPRLVLADDTTTSASPLRHHVSGGITFGYRRVHLERVGSERLELQGGAAGAQLDYGFRLSDAVEIGAGAGYWNGPELNAVVPHLSVRPYLPIDEWREVGVTISGGVAIWPHAQGETTIWTGPSFSVAADFTNWVTSGFGPKVFVEIAAGKVNGEDLKSNSTFFLASGVGIGCAGRF